MEQINENDMDYELFLKRVFPEREDRRIHGRCDDIQIMRDEYINKGADSFEYGYRFGVVMSQVLSGIDVILDDESVYRTALYESVLDIQRELHESVRDHAPVICLIEDIFSRLFDLVLTEYRPEN